MDVAQGLSTVILAQNVKPIALMIEIREWREQNDR